MAGNILMGDPREGDILTVDESFDLVLGLGGDDTFIVDGSANQIDGGRGHDTIKIDSTPIDHQFFQFNGHHFQLLTPTDDTVNYTQVEQIDFVFAPTLNHYKDGIYSINITGSVNNEPFVADLTLQTTVEHEPYVIDLRTVSWDYEDQSTWNNGANIDNLNLINFELTSLQYQAEAPAPTKGTVDVDANGVLTYTPTAHLDGKDIIAFSVSDGENIVDRQYDIEIKAIADPPMLTVEKPTQNDLINRINFNVKTKLVDVDTSEDLNLLFSDLPAGVSLFRDEGMGVLTPVVDGKVALGSSGVEHNENFVLEVPKFADSNFNFIIIAQSDEGAVGTDDVIPEVQFAESDPVTTLINYEYTTNTFAGNVQSLDQSMWSSGDAFVFEDSRSFSTTQNLSGDLFNVVDFDIDVTPGFTSDFLVTSGDVDTTIQYQATVDSFYNITTDTLDIETNSNQKTLNTSSFETTSPQVSYSAGVFLDVMFDIEAELKLKIDLGPIGDIKFEISFFDIEGGFDLSHELFNLNDAIPSFSLNIPNLDINLEAQIPNVNTTSSFSGTDGVFIADGEDEILIASIDVLDLLRLFIPALPPTGFSADVGPLEASLDIIDVDLFGSMDFEQSFTLSIDDILTSLTAENKDVIDIKVLGDTARIENASSIDDRDNGGNGNGDIEFSGSFDFAPEFTNMSGLGFDIGLLLKLITARVEVEIGSCPLCIEFDKSATAFETSFDLDLLPGPIPIHTTTFNLDVDTAPFDFIA